MNFTFGDTAALLLATAACGGIVAVPGYTLTRIFGFGRGGTTADPLTGIVIGLAVLPALDSIAVRFVGLDAALAATLLLAAAGLVLAVLDRVFDSSTSSKPSTSTGPSPWIGLALVACWLLLVTAEWVDLDIAGKLYQPITVYDAVKHAATTQAIYDSGAPPRDAFFLRPERSSYYYFFYTMGALAMRLCGGLVDAKAAVGGLVFWTGIGAYGLVRLVLARIGVTIPDRRRLGLILAIMAAGGLDSLAVLYFAVSRHYWVADPLHWNEEVGAWFEDILWVPHHVTALIAGTVGLIALCNAMAMSSQGRALFRKTSQAVALAAFAFASMLGLSVWVALGFVVTVAAWGLVLLVERRWRALILVVLGGGLALVLAVPQIIDLAAGRAKAPFPIAAMVRGFTPVELLVPEGAFQILANVLTLPLNYAIEFGVLALGSLLYWRHRRAAPPGNEFARVLTITAIAGLLVGGFLRSTIFNNDLGWRVALLPLLAGTVWTIAALDRLFAAPAFAKPFERPAVYAMLGLGWTTVLYTTITMRTYPFMTINPSWRFMASDPATERDLRVAYGWAATHLPSSAVLQQNPTRNRVFAFGVYGRNQIAVADVFGSLYGADPLAVAARIDAIGPIFKTSLAASDIGARATANGIDDIIVTAADPVWSQPESFVWRAKPIFASDRVRIIPVVTIVASR